MNKVSIILLAFVFVLCHQSVEAQCGRDCNWIFGFHCWLDFSSGIPIAKDSAMIGAEESCITMSDASGNLLFYSNGFSVWNRHHQKMPNGDSLKISQVLSYFADTSGNSNALGITCVPSPNSSNKYFLIYRGQPLGAGLYYSKVDMNADSGFGDIVEKDVLFFPYSNYLTEKVIAIKHANGRDWWILTPSIYSDTIFSFLVTSINQQDTILGPFVSVTGITSFSAGLSQMAISPDGNRIADVSIYGGVFVLNFDRCEGTIYNPVSIRESMFPSSNDSSRYYGCSFSPNGSKLYVTTYGRDIWQVNLENEAYTWYKVWQNPYPMNIVEDTSVLIPGSIRIGPNNKVYLSVSKSLNWPNWNYNFNQYISVINFPDLLGALCDFSLNGVSISSGNNKFISLGLPSYVNYNLSAIDNSPCDTLGLGITESRISNSIINIYPNPTIDELTIEVLNGIAPQEIDIKNAIGITVMKLKQTKPTAQINIKSLSAGVYFVKVKMQNGEIQVKKFVKE